MSARAEDRLSFLIHARTTHASSSILEISM